MKNVVKTGAVSVDAVSELEKRNSEISYEIARESIVLLKNDGALPVEKGSRVALYGNGAIMTLKGGTGSGEVHERSTVSVLEGLQHAGFQVSSVAWLSDYQKEYDEGLEEYSRKVRGALQHAITHLNMAEFGDAFGMNYEAPYGRPVTEADVKESDTEICFYVIARQCGENMDRNPDDFSFHLTEKELRDIRFCAAHYSRMVLVLNVGASMSLAETDEIPGLNAILYMGMLGQRGGDAFASVISGETTPSGHLTETWVKNYDDVPNGRAFGKMNPNVLEQDYKEGIYVGYRYYDSFRVPVQYPFGYGLSYTEFELGEPSAAMRDGKLTVQVPVKNTGAVYSGKAVVQLYVTKPGKKLECPDHELAAFAKTGELKPGEAEAAELTVDFRLIGSYCEETKETLLEAGDYSFSLGQSIADAVPAVKVTLPEEVVLSKHRGLGMRPVAFQELKQEKKETESGSSVKAALALTLSPEDFRTEEYDYSKPYPALDPESQRVLDSLSLAECAALTVGDGLDLMGKPHAFICPGAVGYTTSKLTTKGVPLLIFSDGPNGLRIQKRNSLKKDRIRAVDPMGDIFLYLPKWIYRIMHDDEKKSKLLYQFVTSFPVGNMVAQTWNVKLGQLEGAAVSDEMAKYGINYWLAPGVNIHRNPLNGRNYEYYSEDPCLTGWMAAAVTAGVQKRSGTYVTLKHFCCNNQEEQRGFQSSNVSERAMREIYLKGFEIAVKESRPMGIMTSYNRTNGLYNNNNRALLEDVLRTEWGFAGAVMTDWLATSSKVAGQPDLAMAAGNDLLMPGSRGEQKQILKAIKEGKLGEADLRKCAGNIIRIARRSRNEDMQIKM